MMPAIGQLLLFLLDVLFWILVVQIALSWLIAFGVVNLHNPQAANFVRLLDRVTTPIYAPLRKIIPAVGGIDLSPIVIFLGIYLLKGLVVSVFFY